MKTSACWLELVVLAVGGTMHAQAPRRLPVIDGNGLVTVLQR
jgi:hypothetical protein